MSDSTNTDQKQGLASPERRKVLMAGAGLLAAPLLQKLAPAAQAAQTEPSAGHGPFSSRAYGAAGATSPLQPIDITRRAIGPHDVLLDILYCGICHSDIHTVRGEWGPTPYPSVPGHEIIGRVRAVGSAVSKFKVGDIGGIGCMVNSCGTCPSCLNDLEQYCLKGATWTYGSPEGATSTYTLGGYSDKIVVTEHFVIRIPPGADLPATAPLLCAAITTFSPMQHWKLALEQRVGVIGLGGLGHMAVKLGAARKADVTVFTTSPGKVADANRLGARAAVLSTDAEAVKRLAGQFDLLISTVPQAYAMQPFIDLLKLDGTLVNVGAMEPLQGIHGLTLALGRRSLAGSVIGGIAETQEVVDYCAARNIKADIELISVKDINRAYERVMNKDVRYRFVIDMRSMAS
jgi:uncharacterized zinc-type alcohol dehydrogenase-like protein